MSSLTNFAQKKLLDKTLGLVDWALPTTYLALFLSSPGESGSLASELTYGGYARVELTSKMAATVLGTGIAINNATISFATPTTDAGTIGYWGVCDASSAGNVLLYGPLTLAWVVNSGDFPPNFVPGLFSVTMDSASSDPTQYLAKKWLDHVLGIAAYTMPTAVYLGQFTSDPGATGSLAGEMSGGGYGRQNITSLMDATTLATGIAINNDTIAFATPTADWGTLSHHGVMDALTSGNMLLRRARAEGMSVVSGSRALQIDAGSLVLRAQ